MNPTTSCSLRDMADSCQTILTWCASRSFAEYQVDRLFRRAVEREFEIVGEALKRLRETDPAVFEFISHAVSVVGFRNRLVHGYDAIDDAVVWGAIEGHLPVLTNEINDLLKKR